MKGLQIMGQQEEEFQQIQKKQSKSSLRSKAVHFVSDLTTLLLNPISDRTSNTPPNGQPSSHDDLDISELCQSDSEEHSRDSVDGPDTSSFTAFMYSLLASGPETRENSKKNSLLSKGKQSLNYEAATLGGFRNQSATFGNGSSNSDEGIPIQTFNESLPSENLPETSEPSLLLSEKTRSVLYTALPVIVHGQKWILIYSTFRHGMSLLTLYRRSMLCPGFSLLVVGDRKGAVFGGLVEAPLRPTNKRRYQGTNNSFVFTNVSGHAMIFSPTGINRYFTLCSTEYLALGGGDHFALYLDGDLTNGSSSSSETYGNPCLARSDDFQVKEIELWGFVFDSKYEEIIASLCTEPPGICH